MVGQNEFTGAPSYVDMDGTNNFTSGGNFTDLSGTPSAFVTAKALYRVNATPDAIEESATTIDDYTANKLILTTGTSSFEMDDCDLTFSDDVDISASFTVSSTCTIDQNLAKAQVPQWGGLRCYGELRMDDADDRHIILGAGEDAYIYYNGSNLIIDSDMAGTGGCVINGFDINNSGYASPISAADGSAPTDSFYYSTSNATFVYYDSNSIAQPLGS